MLRSSLASTFLVLTLAPLPAQRAVLDQLPPDGDAYAFRHVGFGHDASVVTLPGDGAIQGLAKCGERLWIARGERLLGVSWPACELQTDVAAPPKARAWTADDRFLYASSDAEILVLDPLAGRVVRTMPLALDGRAVAIAAHGDVLYACVGGQLFEVDKRTGAATPSATPVDGFAVQWLASDGGALWRGAEASCERWQTGERARWATKGIWPKPLRASTATWIEGKLLLATEYVDRQRNVERTCQLLPPAALTNGERLSLKLHVANGHPKWEIGPKPVYTLDRLTAELQRIARDPSAKVEADDGSSRLMPVVIEIHPGVPVRDLVRTWDTVVAAGFADVSCPPQEEWVKQQERAKQQPPATKDKR